MKDISSISVDDISSTHFKAYITMTENEVYSLITPNLVEVKAVAIKRVATRSLFDTWLMYSQNRLFTVTEYEDVDGKHYQYGIIVCDYCVIPQADSIIENSYHTIKLNMI